MSSTISAILITLTTLLSALSVNIGNLRLPPKSQVAQVVSAPQNPSAYWSFDEGSGTVAADSSGNSHNATLVNSPTWVSGKLGSALQLNGTNQYASFTSIPLSSDFTLSTWFKQTSGCGMIIGNDQNAAILGYEQYCGGFWLGSDGGTMVSWPGVIPSNGSWHNAILTANRTTNLAELWIDGVSQGTKNISGFNWTSSNNAPQYIGKNYSKYFAGSIDDVRIYNRVLTNQEVSDLYNSVANPTPPTPTPAPVTPSVVPDVTPYVAPVTPSSSQTTTQSTQSSTAALKAFPTAEGFGVNTLGGRGGRVIEVTNLSDSGTGSLRSCVEDTGPRTCIFRVSGTIQLYSTLAIRAANSYITIAGQTSPGGIQLKGYGMTVQSGGHDVIIRYLRIRPGTHLPIIEDTNGFIAWGSGGSHVYNIILDHCDFQWATDQNGPDAVGDATDITTQWSIISEGTTIGHEGGEHSMGVLTGGSADYQITVSYHHNLFAHNGGRNPLIGASTVVDFRNNIVYDFHQGAAWGGFIRDNCCALGWGGGNTAIGNIVNNYYISEGWDRVTRDTTSSSYPIMWLANGGPIRIDGIPANRGGTKVYTDGNWGPRCPTGCADDWDNRYVTSDYETANAFGFKITVPDPNGYPQAPASQFRSLIPFTAPSVTTHPTASLFSVVLPRVGVSNRRDSVDTRVVNDVINGTGNLWYIPGGPWPDLSTGAPALPTDSDHDGVPDSWESSHGLNANSSSDGATVSSNGYTNLENYLNELAGDNIPITTTQIYTPAPYIAPTVVQTQITTPPPVPTQQTTQSPIGWWKFDGNASDSSGNNLNGNLVNGPTYTTGKNNSALHFDGINDSVDIADSAVLHLSSAFSVSAWVNPDVASTNFRSILLKDPSYGLYASGSSNTYLTGGTCASGVPLGEIYNTSDKVVCASPALPVNTWTHLATTYDGVTFKLYRNGSLVASTAYTGGIPISTGILQIGATQFGEYFQGLIDEVQLYNRAISATEVQTLYTTLGGSSTTNSQPPSTKFTIGARVQSVTSGVLNVRATADTAGVLLGTQSNLSLGVVVGGPVSQDGLNWWQVNYDTGVDGWSVEDFLSAYTAPTQTTQTTSASPQTSTPATTQTQTQTTVTTTAAPSVSNQSAPSLGGGGGGGSFPPQSSVQSPIQTNTTSQNKTTSITQTQAQITTNKFSIGNNIKTNANVNVRKTASPTGPSVGVEKLGATGIVIGGPTTQGGIIWWQIQYSNGLLGWSAESFLDKVVLDSVIQNQTQTQTQNTTQTQTQQTVNKFSIGTIIKTTTNVKVRQTGSATGGLLGTQSLGSSGKIVGGPVSQGGFTWWNMDYETGVDGWSAEDFLIAYVPTVSTSPTTQTLTPASTKFNIGTKVEAVTSGVLNVRETSNTTGILLGTQLNGSPGVVIGGPVLQNGFNWWNIDYDTGADGWSAEDFLIRYVP